MHTSLYVGMLLLIQINFLGMLVDSVVTKLIDHTKIKHSCNPVDIPLLLYVQVLWKSHDGEDI